MGIKQGRLHSTDDLLISGEKFDKQPASRTTLSAQVEFTHENSLRTLHIEKLLVYANSYSQLFLVLFNQTVCVLRTDRHVTT
jgi:hypothetical protein